MRHEPRDPEGTDASVEPDVLPEDAPRGGITVPDANDTGMTTPPIAGWGEPLPGGDGDEDDDARPPGG
ncbi:MAG TPA: hypothetical protein VMP86_03450 [Candidatus Binatia bacterium]|nr:hypothetical protein [Candidatus Binatia bacterium]